MGDVEVPSLPRFQEPIIITIEQAQKVITKHLESPASVTALEESKDQTFSSLTATKTYIIRLSDNKSYILKASPPTPEFYQPYTPNTLISEHTLLQLISSHPGIPHPAIHAFDDSHTDIPHPYLLLSLPSGTSLAKAKASGKLTERQTLLLDLKVGKEWKKVHDAVQNEWFGLPKQEKEGIYSWQEAFTGLLESLLEEVSLTPLSIPVPNPESPNGQEDPNANPNSSSVQREEIRKYLSRAIGFFLFDDCDVPSFISFLGDESSVFVDFDPENPTTEEDIKITSLLSTSHALWGDPLLETVFMNPNKAFLEGYEKKLVLFPRQRTKRVWYDLFVALAVLVLVQRGVYGEGETNGEWIEDKERWATELLNRSVETLKDAPYY